MPIRLLDTYTGHILEVPEIVSLLKIRRDYQNKLEDAVSEAKQLATPNDPECPSPFQRPKLSHLDNFIAEYLAFAMFSHRWRGREPSLDDVRKATHGIYSMDDKDLVEERPKFIHPPKNVIFDFSTGVEKLQEFCCLVAKCGFRWAWSDTCCINKEDYAETSESINCMFLWYRSSHLTIVYLDDVDDVKMGRVPAVDGAGDMPWFEDREIRKPLPSNPSEIQTSSDIYVATLETKPSLPLYRRLQDRTQNLRSMQPDEQVEGSELRTHLEKYFPGLEDSKTRGKYQKLPIWVQRGWTLQEMIASKRLRFYSKRWTLLEETDDPDTDEAEEEISISSFKYRVRLVDHRTNDIWQTALVRTTGVPREDLVDFKVGTRDVRSRLLWAARRTTTKVEDMAYCLLGIFDVSLPAMYGEGPRAFFRLQDELMKRTGDVSLFDWCGRSSSVNSFLAHSAGCYVEYNLPHPDIPDSTESTFWMIANLFSAIFSTAWSGIKAIVIKLKDLITDIVKSPPPGHALVNGELNLSVFEHQVKCCERLESSVPGDTSHHYKLEVRGLEPMTVSFASHVSNLPNNPKQYYLCRPRHRHTQNVFEILLEFIGYILKDTWSAMWDDDKSDSWSECDSRKCSRWYHRTDANWRVAKDEDDYPQSKLREEMQLKRKEVLRFFEYPFPVYLVHVEHGHRVRMSTVSRVVARYSKFDFTLPVVMRSIL
ncbi:hypothetical protein JVU11DRAFT_10482 [Chiua virens]|nr:hypothetical protein JVU11DRAFT_10482 [Chiua virens]